MQRISRISLATSATPFDRWWEASTSGSILLRTARSSTPISLSYCTTPARYMGLWTTFHFTTSYHCSASLSYMTLSHHHIPHHRLMSVSRITKSHVTVLHHHLALFHINVPHRFPHYYFTLLSHIMVLYHHALADHNDVSHKALLVTTSHITISYLK